MVTLEKINTVPGINPKELTEATKFVIRLDEKTKDTVEEIERTTKDKKGKFVQYNVFLANDKGESFITQFHFLRDLQELREVYGENTTTWAGKQVILDPEEDSKGYKKAALKAVIT